MLLLMFKPSLLKLLMQFILVKMNMILVLEIKVLCLVMPLMNGIQFPCIHTHIG